MVMLLCRVGDMKLFPLCHDCYCASGTIELFLIAWTFFFLMCTLDNETSVRLACVTSLRSKNMAAVVANKLEKGTNLFACSSELAITHL